MPSVDVLLDDTSITRASGQADRRPNERLDVRASRHGRSAGRRSTATAVGWTHRRSSAYIIDVAAVDDCFSSSPAYFVTGSAPRRVWCGDDPRTRPLPPPLASQGRDPDRFKTASCVDAHRGTMSERRKADRRGCSAPSAFNPFDASCSKLLRSSAILV